MASQNVLRVFIASPSDLGEERGILREVVSDLNESLPELDYHIELLGWEDTLPGHGRPQAKINEDVDRCELFIGLLWRRWGTKTGEYTSGFHEEFQRACGHREATGSPEIWLFFRKVEPEQVRDPGKQLQQVLEFRRSIVESQKLLFKEFADPREWERQISNYLLRHILKLAKTDDHVFQDASNTKISAVHRPSIAPPTSQLTDTSAISGSKQLIEVTTRVNQALSRGEVDPLESVSVSEFDVGRLYLLASNWMLRFYAKDRLGYREVNQLYQFRENLDLTAEERESIFRELIGTLHSGLTPGWYWVNHLDREKVHDVLWRTAMNDRDAEVRRYAIDMLKSAQMQVDGERRAEFFKKVLTDQSEEVRESGLAYLREVGEEKDLELVEVCEVDESPTIRQNAQLAKLTIIAQDNPTRAFSIALNAEQIESKEQIAVMEKCAEKVTSDLLVKATRHPSEDVQLLAFGELARRGELGEVLLNLPPDAAKQLLREAPPKVRVILYTELIRRGMNIQPNTLRAAFSERLDWYFAETNELFYSLYSSFPPDELELAINWYSLEGPIAYKVLALKHFGEHAKRIRSDLSDGFEKLKQASSARRVSPIPEQLDEYSDFIRADFTASALAGIALHGNPGDIQIGRQCLKEAFQKSGKMHRYEKQLREAIHVIGRFGDASDAGILIEVAKNSYDEVKRVAADVALKLDPGVEGAARTMLKSNDSTLAQLAIKSLSDENSERVKRFLEPFLGKEVPFQLEVLAYFVKCCSREELEQLLTRYLEERQYYFHVVCWLDRVLYAPSPIREAFVRQLEAELEPS